VLELGLGMRLLGLIEDRDCWLSALVVFCGVDGSCGICIRGFVFFGSHLIVDNDNGMPSLVTSVRANMRQARSSLHCRTL
jgi:hypothetical protein